MFPEIDAMEIQTYGNLQTETAVDSLILPETRLSHLEQSKSNYDQMVLGALEIAAEVDPDLKNLPVGVEVPTLSAVNWTRGRHNVDIRPRLVDKSTGIARLIDSGAQLSATVRRPEDKVDDSVRLVAVNGSRIQTYGTRDIEFKINRKTYRIPAMICDISQDILGMDFINKYKLNLEWDDFDQSELFLVDKRSQVRSLLKIVTVPTNLQRAHRVEMVSSEPSEDDRLPADTVFQVACMKSLGKEKVEKLSVQDALKKHPEKYVKMIQAHPELLEPTFQKG